MKLHNIAENLNRINKDINRVELDSDLSPSVPDNFYQVKVALDDAKLCLAKLITALDDEDPNAMQLQSSIESLYNQIKTYQQQHIPDAKTDINTNPGSVGTGTSVSGM